MLRSIHLHGRLKKLFGASHRFSVDTAAEAVRALNCAFPKTFLAELNQGSYKIVRGDRRSGMQLDIGLVSSLKLGMADLHIIPVAKGASSQTAKGTTKLVLGAALVGAAVFFSGGTLATPLATTGLLSGTTYGSLALIGVGLAVAGAATLLSKTDQTAQASNNVSVSGGDIGNNGQQGSAVALIYGEVVTSQTTPISVASDIEDIGVYDDLSGSIEQEFLQAAYGARVTQIEG